MRVATYNVHAWVGADGRYDPRRCLAVVAELAADVVGMQEVTLLDAADAARAPPLEERARHTEARLAEATGMSVVAGPTMRRAAAAFGNLLLSRHPVVAVRRHDISTRDREPRGVLDVELEVNGRRERVLVCHLGLNAAERTRQVHQLVELLRTPPGAPAILLGDLNQWFPWWGAARPLNALFGGLPLRRSFPARFPLLPLDRIFVRPGRRVRRVVAHRSRLSRQASDHLPVYAELTVMA